MKKYIKPEITVMNTEMDSILAATSMSDSLDSTNTITGSEMFESKKNKGGLNLWEEDADDIEAEENN